MMAWTGQRIKDWSFPYGLRVSNHQKLLYGYDKLQLRTDRYLKYKVVELNVLRRTVIEESTNLLLDL